MYVQINRIKQLIKHWFTRPYSFTNCKINPSDQVNVIRAIDETIIQTVNEYYKKHYPIHNINKLLMIIVQVIAVFIFIGIPKLLKIEWQNKKYGVLIAIILWYSLMWLRYLIYECPENHILISDKKIKVVSQFKRRQMIITGYIKDKHNNLQVDFNQLAFEDIFDKDGKFQFELFRLNILNALEELHQKQHSKYE